jgi:NAD(P)-dependent dehydrogenase (short-subunit alcohol dehydrogenase family)
MTAGALAGKVCVVVGASTGIGRATAEAAARAGASIVLAARRLELCEHAAKEIRAAGGHALAVRADATRVEDHERVARAAADEFGGIDLAFVNAGSIVGVSSVVETPPERFRAQADVNLFAVQHALATLVPRIAARGGGAVVVNTARGGLRGTPGLGTYAATKAGAIMLSLVAAQEAARDQVRINVIAPGYIGSESWWRMMGENGRSLATRVPLGRIGEPAEVADVVVWLLSDSARYLVGTVIPVDGGMTAG